jgi:predicted helicase
MESVGRLKKRVFSKKYSSFEEVEEEISKLETTKERGDAFELFTKYYLIFFKELYQIDKVFLFNEIPYNLKKNLSLEKSDYGVDGIIIFLSGEVAAFQSKFRKNKISAPYGELATFLSESEKADYKYILSNCYSLPRPVTKQKKVISILRDRFESLDNEFFTNLNRYFENKPLEKIRFFPRPHQKRAIKNIENGFKKFNRGKFISACGTGKTLTALWVIEKLDERKILFLVPNLSLIRQTLESWTKNSEERFDYLCVCSDNTVSKNIEMDEEDIEISELGVPVTTEINKIKDFILMESKNRKIIFSTYQSLDVVAEALKESKEILDITICDEAHRTVGIKSGNLFSLAVDEEIIKSKRRIFMTATEKLIRPRIKKRLIENKQEIFSMDDVKKYGPIFEELNFGEAIKKGIISDYKILISFIGQEEIYNTVKENKYVLLKKDGEERIDLSENISRQISLIKAIKEYGIKKVITFHSNIKKSKDFVGYNNQSLKKLLSEDLKVKEEDLAVEHVDGTMTTGERVRIFDYFKDSEIGIVSNARCLTEGVDVPIIDAVYFVNPKNSLIDIIQACGRALRKGNNSKKTSYILVPVLLRGVDSQLEMDNKFETIYYVIQALRDQDKRLGDYIDKLNKHLSMGGTINNFSSDKDFDKLKFNTINLPSSIKFEDILNSLYIGIAEKNVNPTRYLEFIKKYDKGELKSGHVRTFKTIGDYQLPGYEETVKKTLVKFKVSESKVDKKDLFINNNNISHTKRLNLIEKEGDNYRLTSKGKEYYKNKKNFNQIFKEAILSKDEIIFYPYKSFIKFIESTKSMSILQFLYGPYIMKDSSKEEISNAIKRALELKKYNYSLLIKNEKGRRELFKILNEKYGVNFSEADLLMKTTAGNQFKYLIGHLSVFGDSFTYDKKNKILILKKNF